MRQLAPKAQGLAVVVGRRSGGGAEVNLRFIDLRDGREPVGDFRRMFTSATEGGISSDVAASWFEKVKQELAASSRMPRRG